MLSDWLADRVGNMSEPAVPATQRAMGLPRRGSADGAASDWLTAGAGDLRKPDNISESLYQDARRRATIARPAAPMASSVRLEGSGVEGGESDG